MYSIPEKAQSTGTRAQTNTENPKTETAKTYLLLSRIELNIFRNSPTSVMRPLCSLPISPSFAISHKFNQRLLSFASLRQIFILNKKSFWLTDSFASIELAACEPDERISCFPYSILETVRGSRFTKSLHLFANRKVLSSKSLYLFVFFGFSIVCVLSGFCAICVLCF